MRLNPLKRTLSVKVVYYGPGLCGKTTNLQLLHQQFPDRQRGAMLQLDTETERTLFFDYFPLSLGNLGGYRVKVDFFTVVIQFFNSSKYQTVFIKIKVVFFKGNNFM